MATTQGMETFAARLESFATAQTKGKKRGSNAKGGKGTRWPHKSPSPEQLAQAGFYYKPTSSSLDNVQCFSCHKDIDGWESEDDPAREHVALSPECGWATQVALEQEDEGGDLRNEDPMSERMVEARKATFADMWPHEKKRGWTCKVKKMIEAGWYYCPSPESDDYAKCAYCGLCLDGWEPKDKPFDEHQRRSPTCAFFASQTSGKPATTRGKKGRQSKASRMSTQSTITTTTEDHPMSDAAVDQDNSMLSTATDMSMMSTASKAKKAGRPKKGQAKPKARNTRAKAVEPQEPSNVVEPEDDNFEVKVASPPPRATRGKKRTSDEMQAEDVEYPVIPSAKRTTRNRSSTAKPEPIPALPEQDVTMENMEDPIPAPKSQKGGRGGRKRVSTTTRKTSARKASTRAASTASKASLRAPVPADDEIDAQLEADLERFSSDGSENWQVLGKDESEITGLHPSRVRASAGKMAPSAGIREDFESSVLDQAEGDGIDESESVIFERTEPILSPPPQKKSTRIVGKKGKKASASTIAIDNNELAADQAPGDMASDLPEERNPSEHVRVSQEGQEEVRAAQEPSEGPREDGLVAVQEANNASQLTTTTTADDSGHETDGSVLAQKKTKRDSKKPPAKKGKQPKKVAPKTKKVEVTVEIPIPASHLHAETEEEEAPIPDEAPTVVVKTKAEKATGTKAAKTRGKGKKASDQQEAEPADEVVIPEQGFGATAQPAKAAEPQHSPVVMVRIEQPQAPTPTGVPSPRRQIPSPTPTPQSSDAENHPPSSRPSQARPPLARFSPSTARTMRVPLAASTPTGSPSRGNSSNARLQTTYPWSAVDLDYILLGTPKDADKENVKFDELLASPEKKMNVEEWIKYNARRGEEKLKADCERIVGKFENEGVRALKALEGIVCSD